MVFAVKPVYRFEINQEYFGSALVMNTPHFEWSGGGGTTYPSDADCLAVANAFKEVTRPLQTTQVTYTTWKATQVNGDGVTYDSATCRQIGGDAHEGAFTGTLVGARAVSTSPPQNAMVVSLKTGLVGKSRHGRLYFGGFDTADFTNGEVLAARVTTQIAAWAAFLAIYGVGGSSGDWTLVVFSRVIASGCKADPTTRHHPLVHVQAQDYAGAAKHVTTVVVDTVVRSQRTRELGKGA